ncbi:hypothetical protein LGZ99_05465 [Photorhabdus temperata]|uniref:hypothetical protein n=1 Tax=Photorhabdus temperata TaxID=574560 RepID=UPI0006879DFC|nr:hypothetical protein [Photorhabdus temperata]MCT8346677.1 hypothetical protein [Photorhabdus temperata]
MASVTHIRKIINDTSRRIYIVEGQNNGRTHTINANSELISNIKVPWIGNQEESNKAIRITIVDEPRTAIIWIFQDYWNPPHKDQMKYYKGEDFSYANAKNIDGPSSGGGNKIFRFYIDNNQVLKFKII